MTIAHSHTPTQELEALCKEADVVVGAVGQPRLIQPSWLKKDAVVINIGMYTHTHAHTHIHKHKERERVGSVAV